MPLFANNTSVMPNKNAHSWKQTKRSILSIKTVLWLDANFSSNNNHQNEQAWFEIYCYPFESDGYDVWWSSCKHHERNHPDYCIPKVFSPIALKTKSLETMKMVGTDTIVFTHAPEADLVICGCHDCRDHNHKPAACDHRGQTSTWTKMNDPGPSLMTLLEPRLHGQILFLSQKLKGSNHIYWCLPSPQFWLIPLVLYPKKDYLILCTLNWLNCQSLSLLQLPLMTMQMQLSWMYSPRN